MVFSSTVFLFLFFPAVLAAYFICPNRAWRNGVLLLFSVGFYAWGEPCFVWVMLAAVCFNWLAVRWMDAQTGRRRKCVCCLLVSADLFLLFMYKYAGFVTENVQWFFPAFPVVEIVLPIGISFFVFQMLSYVFDVYYGTCRAQKSLWKTMLYASFFPQLIAGPIVRYETIAEELTARTETRAKFADGFVRFTYGLGKKVLISNYLGYLADPIFDGTAAPAVLTAWLASIFYTLQIYYDFSGYSDMAIGIGQMFGFHFPENFDAPYTAASVTEFWRRWHMSLSTWFRDYVYIPLGGNRVSKARWVRNLFVVWLLTGIWHGANWTFVLWGLYYFALLLLEKGTFGVALKRHRVLGHVYTLFAVNAGWVLFRSDSISRAGTFLGAMAGFGGSALWDVNTLHLLTQGWVFVLAAVLLLLPVKTSLQRFWKQEGHAWAVVSSSAVVLVLAVLSCVKATYAPFIYFNF